MRTGRWRVRLDRLRVIALESRDGSTCKTQTDRASRPVDPVHRGDHGLGPRLALLTAHPRQRDRGQGMSSRPRSPTPTAPKRSGRSRTRREPPRPITPSPSTRGCCRLRSCSMARTAPSSPTSATPWTGICPTCTSWFACLGVRRPEVDKGWQVTTPRLQSPRSKPRGCNGKWPRGRWPANPEASNPIPRHAPWRAVPPPRPTGMAGHQRP